MLLRRWVGIETTGVHVAKTVLGREIAEVAFEALAGVSESRGSRKPRSRAHYDAIAIPDGRFQPLGMATLLEHVHRRLSNPGTLFGYRGLPSLSVLSGCPNTT